MMLATAVPSSTLATVAYDQANQMLRLEFRNHAVYWYFGVPPAVHQSLLVAPSKGAYFNRNIRGRFPYRRDQDSNNHWLVPAR
jgi:lysyl-tRNA synthetase class 2